jgi:flavin reductase (DIM6/NTAB) family NADH-FMN oxidoreductase RutF
MVIVIIAIILSQKPLIHGNICYTSHKTVIDLGATVHVLRATAFLPPASSAVENITFHFIPIVAAGILNSPNDCSIPAIAESPVNLACKVVESKELGSHVMYIAEIVSVTVDDAHMNENGKFLINELGLVMYSHGEYFSMGEKLGKFGYSIQKK